MHYPDKNPRYQSEGSFKRLSPLREDCKMRIVNAVDSLQVAKPVTKPFKLIRYPVEDGNLIQKIKDKRSSALQYKVVKTTYLLMFLYIVWIQYILFSSKSQKRMPMPLPNKNWWHCLVRKPITST